MSAEGPQSPAEARRYSIGEISEISGLSRSTLRYYEKVGVLRRRPRVGGRRRYSAEVFRELALLDVAKRAGLALLEIRSLRGHAARGLTLSEAWEEIAPAKERLARDLTARAREIEATLIAGRSCDCTGLDDCTLTAEIT